MMQMEFWCGQVDPELSIRGNAVDETGHTNNTLLLQNSYNILQHVHYTCSNQALYFHTHTCVHTHTHTHTYSSTKEELD